MLTIMRTQPHEAEILHRIQVEAFQDDLAAYQDFETNPACESFEQMLNKIHQYDYYTIVYRGEIVGGASVRKRANEEYRISPMYLLPAYQNKGLGTQIISSLFAFYPEARIWSLDTPKPSLRNRYFYEKLGFISVGETYINERLTLTKYQMTIE